VRLRLKQSASEIVDGSRDDLVYWLRAAERFLEAVMNGWVHKRDWGRWCQIFRSIPVVEAHFSALLPQALEARRLRREHARAEATQRGKLELAKAIPAVPPDARGQWMLSGSVWRWKNYDSRELAHRTVRSGV
jgi:hypothetical protein